MRKCVKVEVDYFVFNAYTVIIGKLIGKVRPVTAPIVPHEIICVNVLYRFLCKYTFSSIVIPVITPKKVVLTETTGTRFKYNCLSWFNLHMFYYFC